MQLKMKLEMVGVSQITNNIEEIKDAFNNFIENGTEFDDSIKLHGAKYVLNMKLINNNKKTAEIFLKYKENVFYFMLLSWRMAQLLHFVRKWRFQKIMKKDYLNFQENIDIILKKVCTQCN